MKYLVEIKQDLTACSVRVTRGPLNRVISEHLFNTEAEAVKFYEGEKRLLKFAGLAGQYACYPHEVPDNYIVHSHSCDECSTRFSLTDGDLGYTELGGDYCSRACMRSAYQNRNMDEYSEEQYEDDY